MGFRRVVGILLLVFSSGCASDAEPSAATGEGVAVPGSVVRHARHFSLTHHDGYSVVRTFGEVAPFQGDGSDVELVEDVMVLVPRGQAAPALTGELAGAFLVETPARRIAVNNDDLLTLISELGLREDLVAVGGLAVYDDSVRARTERGALGKIGYSWHLPPDMEVLLTRESDVAFLAMDSPHNVPALGRARDLGIVAVPAFLWAEADVLARAEWIRFFGAFTGKDEEAARTFDEIEERYLGLMDRVSEVVDTPTVLWGYHAGDDRWMMMANNLEANLLRDAGVHNPLAAPDRPIRQDGEPFSSEALLLAGADAEHWIVGDIHGNEFPRGGYMDEFRAWREGRLYHNYARTNWDVNAYDWYEGAVARPDIVLADLIHLLHPELLPDHELRYLGHFDAEVGR